MSKKNIHDEGIQTRIQQILEEDKYSLLAVVHNIEYHNKFGKKHDICGEIDILKLYFNGMIGIEEVKSTEHGIVKAREQLRRAGDVFKFYNPKLAAYIVDQDKVIKYRR